MMRVKNLLFLSGKIYFFWWILLLKLPLKFVGMLSMPILYLLQICGKPSKYFVIKYELKESSAVMHGSISPVTPSAYPWGFAIFSFLGGIFPTPGQAKRDNSPSLSFSWASYWKGDVCVNVSLESPNSILNSFCSQVEPCCHSIVEPALQSTNGSK